jgi:hypothetical protein
LTIKKNENGMIDIIPTMQNIKEVSAIPIVLKPYNKMNKAISQQGEWSMDLRGEANHDFRHT